jgi:hypothetical protein
VGLLREPDAANPHVRLLPSPLGFPCCVWSPLPACRRQYPAGPMETCSFVRSHRLRPSPNRRRVGPCITLFEACSAFTQVAACMLAESPMRPSTPKASGSFVASATASIATGWNEPVPGRDFSPAEDQRLFTAHSDLRVTRWDLGDHFRIADDSTVCDDLSLCGRRFSLIRLSA